MSLCLRFRISAVTKALQPIPECAGAGSALVGFLRFFCASIASLLTTQFQEPTALAVIILDLAFTHVNQIKNSQSYPSLGN